MTKRYELMGEIDREVFVEQIRNNFPQFEGFEEGILLILDNKAGTVKGKPCPIKVKTLNDLDVFLYLFNNETFRPDALFIFDALIWKRLTIDNKRKVFDIGLAQCEYDSDARNPFKVRGLNLSDDIDLLGEDPQKRVSWHKEMEQIGALAHAKASEESLL